MYTFPAAIAGFRPYILQLFGLKTCPLYNGRVNVRFQNLQLKGRLTAVREDVDHIHLLYRAAADATRTDCCTYTSVPAQSR